MAMKPWMDRSLFCQHEGSFQDYPVECELPKGHAGNHLSKGLLPNGLMTWTKRTAIVTPICPVGWASRGSVCILPPDHNSEHQTWESYWQKQANKANAVQDLRTKLEERQDAERQKLQEEYEREKERRKREFAKKILLPSPAVTPAITFETIEQLDTMMVKGIDVQTETEAKPASPEKSNRERRRDLLRKQQQSR